MITDIDSEERLVQKTFADHLRDVLGWESIYAHNDETFGPTGKQGRARKRGGGALIFSPPTRAESDAPKMQLKSRCTSLLSGANNGNG